MTLLSHSGIDSLITQRSEELGRYGNEKNPKYQALFYDILSTIYLLRYAPNDAQKCLKEADSVVSKLHNTSDSDNAFHNFISVVLKQQIQLFRFFMHKRDIQINDELLQFLNQLVCTFTFDDYYKTLASFILYKYALNMLTGGIDFNLKNTLQAYINCAVEKLNKAGFDNANFSLIPINGNNSNQEN